MFSFFVVIFTAVALQGSVSNTQVQGSYAQVQGTNNDVQVQTELRAVNSQPQPGGLQVEPVHNLQLVQPVAR